MGQKHRTFFELSSARRLDSKPIHSDVSFVVCFLIFLTRRQYQPPLCLPVVCFDLIIRNYFEICKFRSVCLQWIHLFKCQIRTVSVNSFAQQMSGDVLCTRDFKRFLSWWSSKRETTGWTIGNRFINSSGYFLKNLFLIIPFYYYYFGNGALV